jgi:hypothetical protein
LAISSEGTRISFTSEQNFTGDNADGNAEGNAEIFLAHCPTIDDTPPIAPVTAASYLGLAVLLLVLPILGFLWRPFMRRFLG